MNDGKEYDIVNQAMMPFGQLSTGAKILEISAMMQTDLKSTHILFEGGLHICGPGLQHLFNCMGVATDEQCKIWVMTTSGNWMEIRTGQVYADYILDDVSKRLNQLKDAE